MAKWGKGYTSPVAGARLSPSEPGDAPSLVGGHAGSIWCHDFSPLAAAGAGAEFWR